MYDQQGFQFLSIEKKDWNVYTFIPNIMSEIDLLCKLQKLINSQ